MVKPPHTFTASFIEGFSSLTLGRNFDENFRNRDFYHINRCNDAIEATIEPSGRRLPVSYRLVFEGDFTNPESAEPQITFAKGRARAYVHVPREAVELPDTPFRERLAELLLETANNVESYLKHFAQLIVTKRSPTKVMNDVLSCYLSLPAPLSPPPFEHESNPYANNYTGHLTVGDGPFTCFLYFDERNDAVGAAKELERARFIVTMQGQRDRWLCTASVLEPDFDVIRASLQLVQDIADRYNGEFDGWASGPGFRA